MRAKERARENCQEGSDFYSSKPLPYRVTREQFAGLLVSGWVGELRINGGVLDIGMAQPVFDKRQVSAGSAIQVMLADKRCPVTC